MIRVASLWFAALPALVLGACAKEKELSVTDAYVRYAAVPANPSAAYFTIHGGAQDVSLIGVSTDVAIRSEMHESMKDGAAMSMKPVMNVQVPAGNMVKFEPGGKHVMLWNINPGVKPPKRITLTLAFSNGQELTTTAPLIAAGAPAPGAE
jgi:periplasmic copper chaperone A